MGKYGPEEWWYPTGAPAASVQAIVFEADQSTFASIYSDAGLTTPLPNPTTTDASGLLEFYAVDGDYWVYVGDDYSGDSELVTVGPAATGAVLSVNGQTGVVVLDAGDVGADPAGSAAAAAAASQPLATIDAKGDLYAGTGDNATARRSVGADGTVLTASAADPTGMVWAAPAPGGVTSVNGDTGVVVLNAADVGADPAGSAAAAQAAAIAASDPVGSAAAAAAASQPLATINALGDLYVGTGDNATTRLPRGANGEVLATNDAEPTGLEWIAAPSGGGSKTIEFTDDRKVLTTGNGAARWYNRQGALTIVGAWVSAGVQPTDAAILVDVNLNGSTIYSTQANRPTVAAASNGGGISATPDVTALAVGDYLTVDIDQIGSTIPGGLITVGIVVQ